MTTKDPAVVALLDSDEVWDEDPLAVRTDILRGGQCIFLAINDCTRAQARIAACAPEALRILRNLEWSSSGEETSRVGGFCPDCYCAQDDGHDAHCELDALLRKAGCK